MRSSRLRSRTLAALLLVLVAGAARAQDNVLVIVIDDVGVDRIGAYREHPSPGNTPTVDQLAASGMLFRNAWVHPSCTPTRAALLTGRYPARYDLGAPLIAADPAGLPLSEITIPEMLEAGTAGLYTSVALGKWHLAALSDGPRHPLDQGFAHHRGSLGNFADYFHWSKTIDGVTDFVDAYATTDLVDDAIVQIELLTEPWFLWLAFNAAHVPFHAPPDDLHSFALSGPPRDTPVEHMKAAVEALDTELGRLLGSIDPDVLGRTTIILVGDNGTTPEATDAPFDPEHAKATAYEGGVNVPLIVAGPRVRAPGSESRALVAAVDLFATVADIAGVDLPAVMGGTHLDSISFLPHLQDPDLPSTRSWVFTDGFVPNGPGPYVRRTLGARNERYKIVLFRSYILARPQHELFDLLLDPFEQENLLDGRKILKRLFTDLYDPLQALVEGF